MADREYKTNSRMKILEFLKENGDRAVSVAQIQAHLDETGVAVNKTTIYRYLDKLEREGTAARFVEENGKKASYQLTNRERRCSEHLHLKCVRCGCIQHLDCGFMDEIEEHIMKEHGFQIQCRNSVIYGICAGCRSRDMR